jgi:hypothetical protein
MKAVTLKMEFSDEEYDKIEFAADEVGETIKEYLKETLILALCLGEKDSSDDSEIDDGVYKDEFEEIDSQNL